jgi:hypothetical protein
MTTTATPGTTAPRTTAPRTTLLDRVGPAALVLGAAGNLVSAVATPLLGERPVGVAAQVAAVADRPLAFGVVMGVGALAVPALATGLVWAARLLRPRMPRTATAAAGLLVAGMWGLFAVHVLALTQLAAALSADRAGAVAALTALESSPLLPVLVFVPFLAGCVLGITTLAVGLLRTHVVARWVPLCLLAFLVLDFGVGRVGPVDPHWLFLAGAVGLALHARRVA